MSTDYLPTKYGKEAPQEFAIAKDLALPCIKCGRKTMFLKAAFCEICKTLWFYGQKERVKPIKEMLNKPEQIWSFSELEMERIFFIDKHGYKIEFETDWHEYLKKKSNELYEQYKKYSNWKPNATWKKLGTLGV